MVIGPPAAINFARVPFAAPVPFKLAGSPEANAITCPVTPVTYPKALPVLPVNMITLPTASGTVPGVPGMVKQAVARVTEAEVITPAHTGVDGAVCITG